MGMFKSSNPLLGRLDKTVAYDSSESMTIQGTVNKTLILTGLIMVSASMTWKMIIAGSAGAWGLTIGGAIVALIAVIVMMFKMQWAGFLAPLYALAEGLFLGGISAVYSTLFDGIVLKAVALTFGVLLAMLFMYKSGIIKATEKFKQGVMAATLGVVVMYGLTWLLSMFGVRLPYLHEGGLISIGISLVVIVIAALNLILDFDNIEQGVAHSAPKTMEWMGAVGLMVTLVWLYVEILRLLSFLTGRD